MDHSPAAKCRHASCPLQLDIGLRERDHRWHCARSFERQHRQQEIEIFFIDTNPAIEGYQTAPFADNKGAVEHAMSGTAPLLRAQDLPALILFHATAALGGWMCALADRMSATQQARQAHSRPAGPCSVTKTRSALAHVAQSDCLVPVMEQSCFHLSHQNSSEQPQRMVLLSALLCRQHQGMTNSAVSQSCFCGHA